MRPAPRSSRRQVGRVAALLLLAIAPGVVNAADRFPVAVNAIAIGGLSRTDLAIGMVEARVTVSPHLQLTAAPTIVLVEKGDTEHQLRAAATLSLRLGPISLDDRNMWVFSDAGTTRYRNRLRLTVPAEVGGRVLRFQAFEEAYYDEGGRGWFRHLRGAGIGFDVGRSVSADAYWTVLDDDHRPADDMFLLVLTAHIRR